MSQITDSLMIKGQDLKNRLVMPPMVMFGYSDEEALVTPKVLEHYRHYAKTGVGLVVVEATCINPQARLSRDQLGIWDDKFIPGLKEVAEAIKAEGAVAVIQIHHAGLKSVYRKVAPSPYSDGDTEVEEISAEEIQQVIREFTDAAIRAQKAGFDGVELHGAHGYLISQFLSAEINKRTDVYGGSVERRANLPVSVIKAVREACGKDFIIGIRMGGNEPDSVAFAKIFEQAGCDYIHVSYGFSWSDIEKPANFPGHPIQYAASLIKKEVNIPVVAVYKVTNSAQVKELLSSDYVDMVAVARSVLVDPQWYESALRGLPAGECIHCRSCVWHQGRGSDCPGAKLWNKKRVS